MINTAEIKRFAREARKMMIRLVSDRLDYINKADTAELRVKAKQIKMINDEIKSIGRDEFIEKISYTWFNRFMALRFMDANGYNNPMVLTANESEIFPEIFQEAKANRFNEDLIIDKERFNKIIDRVITYNNPENEAYKMLLVAECNRWHKVMPFVFEKVDDYSEILLPEDLLTETSIIAFIRKGMSVEDCQYEELIGWIYQFYNSEKKDEVFAGLAKNKKISPENIPAATQLFTPHWIVKYLVENTLGKLWLDSHPESKLKGEMEYLVDGNLVDGNLVDSKWQIVDSEKQESTTTNYQPSTTSQNPTSIRFLDPCMGSGHILVYAFDLFAKIYEEEGYNRNEIPRLILENNIYGIDIDDRAVQLAHFALTMKARKYYSRYFRNPVEPNVISLQNYDNDLFRDAKNFGSLIRINKEELDKLKVEEDTIFVTRQSAIRKQAEYLANQYHCVVTNPPYMGGGGMNTELKNFVQKNYQDSKLDLFACFMERCIDFAFDSNYMSMINQHSWMFLSSYEILRNKLIENYKIENLMHLGARAFDEIGGEVVQSVAFVIKKEKANNHQPSTINCHRLVDYNSAKEKEKAFIERKNFYHANQSSFSKIPGSPIAYWASEKVIEIFDNSTEFYNYTISDGQNKTGNNEKYVREFWEINASKIGKDKKWIFYAKGGGFRKWYGNIMSLINWSLEARNHYKKDKICRIIPEYLWYKKGITWGLITSNLPSFRILTENSTFDVGGSSIFFKDYSDYNFYLALLNTKLVVKIINMSNPTLNFQVRDIRSLPIIFPKNDVKESIISIAETNINISRKDWDSRETSFDFKQNELIKHKTNTIEEAFELYRKEWSEKFYELHRNEEELNRQFIEIYGLQDELTPDVPLKDVTILQQELFREKLGELVGSRWWMVDGNMVDGGRLMVDGEKADGNMVDGGWQIVDGENNQPSTNNYQPTTTNYQSSTFLTAEYFDCAEIVKQLISYAVGCMMGRYSLDKDGLVLANQGETVLLVDGGRLMVDSKWQMVDGEKADGGRMMVDALWCVVDNKNNIIKIIGGNNDNTELQRPSDMATGDGNNERSIFIDEENAEGRNVWSDQSDKESCGQYSEQHSGGTCEKSEGIQELSNDSKGFISRIRNTVNIDNGNSDVNTSGDREHTKIDGIANQTNEQFAFKNPVNTLTEQPYTINQQLSTTNQSLSTTHYSPSTINHPPSTMHFLPDADGIIPILEDEFFHDDIVGKFTEFISIVFGKENLRNNIEYIEKILGKDLRKYFLKDFYNDHIKRYKKRPIYWLFSSPNKSFNALIYMHRYTPDMISVLLNNYFREYKAKLEIKRQSFVNITLNPNSTAGEKLKAEKEMQKIDNIIRELNDYEVNLHDAAMQRIEIDLDDGVKVNYQKFKNLLYPIKGLEKVEES